jgi:hypothetical protein
MTRTDFNTVEEVTRWTDFTIGEKVYDLSHLNAHWAEYIDHRNEANPTTYRFIVTYSFHCFAKESADTSAEQSQQLMYRAPKDSRPFNIERYELSQKLPGIIKSLGDKEILVFHAGYESYAAVKIINSTGNEVNYFVPFKVFKERKRFRIHVTSAYPKEDIGKVRKVSFFVIAKNLSIGKKLPSPS